MSDPDNGGGGGGRCQVKVKASMSPRRRRSHYSSSSLTLNHVLPRAFFLLVGIFCAHSKGQPNFQDTMQSPVAVIQGENAPLTCVVRELGEASVVWKKWENGKSGPKILTAGEVRVTSDERVRIIHDQGGDVWVLAIRDALPSDSGLYICEVNTNPVLRSFHNLTVISLEVAPPKHFNETLTFTIPPPGEDFPFQEFSESYKGQGSIGSHNYTSCCVSQNVSRSCLGFCTLQSILDGSTGEPSQCENEFPRIVKCMADGRDHVPCCVREGVPDICQDLCRGEYTIVTDNVKTHFSCPTFIERTLACIADGVEILSSEPVNLVAQAISQSSINASWLAPAKNGDTVTEYVVNVTTLRSYDPPYTGLGYGPDSSSSISGSSSPNVSITTSVSTTTSTSSVSINHRGSHGIDISSEEKVEAFMRQIKVHGDLTNVLITQLQPFTMYEISVIAFNIHGRSLPSNRVRTLTLAPGIVRPNSTTPPTLPDIQTCCIQSGVNSETCVAKLCDPRKTTTLEIPDLMICAPWTPQVFKCLADGKDHTPCCRERGVPSPCSDLCSGNVTKLDYHYFKCLRYMSEYSNCLMDGYGVLPSAPRQVRVSNVNEDFVFIHWSPPAVLVETVTGYNIHYRPLGTFENLYTHIKNVHSPYILENLYANAEYEVYVEAVNDHGVSEASQRVVFRTASQNEKNAELEANSNLYNETACCVSAGLSPTCMPLCSYEASMSDIRTLAFACASEFHTILRCAAGGRDHSTCCAKRGVTESCIDVCSAKVPDSLKFVAENCLPFIGNIVQCFDSGTEIIPPAVEEFHAFLVTDSSVGVAWDPPVGYNVTQYQVFYQYQNPASSLSKPSDLKSVNVTDTSTEITGLDKDSMYKFYVVAVNEHGSSVPSSMVQLKVSSTAFDGSKIPGIVSAPHGLVVAGHGATWVQIVWQPPAIAHPTDKITYKVYHRGVKESEYQTNESSVNSVTLDGLKPNSQYILYVTARSNDDKGESQASETLIAWTDPAHSPFVEPPRIQPLNLLIEGRSMTVVCVALGDPTPSISLYINGKLMKTQKNRHLTQVVENITRDMDIVSCYADNGYGTPMQAARRIQVAHLPSISGSDVTYASLGDSASIECSVVAFPEPKVAFWRSSLERIPIVNGGNFRIEHVDDAPLPLLDQPHKSKYVLKIMNVSEESIGNYSCHAENAIGEMSKTFIVKTRDLQDSSMNITECCVREKVSEGCMDACSFFSDIESILDKPQCLPDFDKLMKCSADGRDHRACCANWGVPRRCLDLCRGEPVSLNPDLCILQNSKQIFSCFKENRDKLPGPPQNVKVEVISDTEVKVSWEFPTINPNTATVYRVFWRPIGQKLSERQDTQTTSLRIANLKPGHHYETVIKAGNNRGTSILTEPVGFTTENNFIASASTAGGSNVALGFGIAFLVCLVLGAAVASVWFIRNRQFGLKPPGAIAFENPSYIRETNPDIHMNGDGPSNGSVPSVSNGVTANGWHTETLHPPRPETEVPPTLYEELRLGSEGVGFRRLKN
ncbi:Ig-like and fibronectin type-III domain-containing protein 1 [Folsomia candida]|uniref:Ig-like and fibronectin type-III domain-containing protein 1 n=1 Tax=Folsomia candida TaxID=158441 RepID=UPI000B904988|nr:Ig-like and fibronectin type-III domain-containing protein 1 [Folsomia candida]XP_035712784.1 Ig-like and fibronectin type-III domain-containing protein 1 [Folsomia candida]